MSVPAPLHPDSADTHLAAIESHLAALAGMPAVDRAGGDHLSWALRVLTVRRQEEALTAGSLDAMACSGQWSTVGGRTAAGWLAGSTTEAPQVVKTLLANGAFTRTHALLDEAALAGEVSGEHVSAWRIIRRRYARIGVLLDAAETHILHWARELAPKGFTAALVEFAHRLDPDLVDDIDAKHRRRVFLDAVATLDGYVHVNGFLDPITGDLLIQALEAARRAGATADAEDDIEVDSAETDADTGNDTGADRADPGEPAPEDPHADPAKAGRTVAERNPEALRRLLDLATAVTGPDGLPIINGTRPRISVHIDAEDLVESNTAAGTDPAEPGMGLLHRFGIPTATITATQTAILACDATLAPLVVDRSGQIVAVLPGTRTIAPALRTAICTRDEHCRFPNCSARIDEVHHIVFHSHGGPTTRSNLVGLCHYHHQLIHTQGWQVTGDPDTDLHFTHHAHYTPNPTAPPTTPAGLTARQRKRQATQAARALLADPKKNPARRYTPNRYALLDRERNQAEDPPF